MMPVSRPAKAATVSVVVPAKDEQEMIGRCVRSAYEQLQDRFLSEIIVVDDGSDDRTSKVASREGAVVLEAPTNAETIARVRNYGADRATGKILVFLDADVELKSGWGERFEEIADNICPPSKIITGSSCQIPENPSWIERYWFQEQRQRATYLGTGHLVINREFFLELGGFDETLLTGEDYEFCQRAIRHGGSVRPDSRLEAVHHGFPRDLLSFARREIWHGRGDFSSLSTVLRSKVALASLMFVTLFGVTVVGLATGIATLVLGGATGIAILIGVAASVQFDSVPLEAWCRIVPLYLVYFGARAISVVVRVREIVTASVAR